MENPWIDITMPIKDGMVHWPGDVDVRVSKQVSFENGDDANVTILHISAHTGTHIDAPLHFIRNGADVTEISFDLLTGNTKIIEIKDPVSITVDELKTHNIVKGDKILFKTANSDTDWVSQPFNLNYIFLTTAAANYMNEKGVSVIGVDYLSVAGKENGIEVHRLFLSNKILIIEGLKLQNIDPGNYEMICLPLKIENADGAPARVIVRKKQE